MTPTAPESWSIDETSRPDLRAVLAAAYGEIGVREEPPGSNRGPRVDVYTGGVAMRWCVAFVRWCYAQGWVAFPRTNGVSELVDWGAANGALVHRGRLLPGDVFAIERPRVAGGEEEHHAGLVVRDLGDGRACCIEGNHADGVAATIRSGAEFTAVVRIVPLAVPA